MMEIISSEITSDSIDLVTTLTVTGFVLHYGERLKTEYSLTGLSTTTITITKEALGLETLDNIYFRLKVEDNLGNEATVGLYYIDIINDREAQDYDANTLKQELDNLNYYDGILVSLNEKGAFLEANDFFFNFIRFLEKELNGNNFIQAVNGQENIRTSNC